MKYLMDLFATFILSLIFREWTTHIHRVFVPGNTSDLRDNLIGHDESRCLGSPVTGGG